MTRAADRLVVCGAMGERGKPPGCWYELVHGALTPAATEEPADDGDGPVWRLRQAWPAEIEATEETAATAAGHGGARPAWLDQDAPPERPSEHELSPSRAYDESSTGPASAGAGERLKALARGTLVHRLLQGLPAMPAERRAEAAHRHLARSATLFTAPERDGMVEQVRGVLEDPRFRELFGPHSRAEVPIVGRIQVGGRTIAVAGQVDRLAVTAAGVLIADYKTNRPAPRRHGEVPPGYMAQLALYRAVLRLVYPERAVRAALVWTDAPDLMEISAEALDQALAALTSP
jgi:ATP-dependent helicase/nuclease subunit A